VFVGALYFLRYFNLSPIYNYLDSRAQVYILHIGRYCLYILYIGTISKTVIVIII